MKNYAVYASGKCTRIRKFIDAYPDLAKLFKCVITDEKKDDELQLFFQEKGIQYFCFDYKSMTKEKDRNLMLSDYLLDILRKNKINYCFSFGGHILKGKLLEEYCYRLINFHPGIIPEVVGLHAIDKAISENKRFIGNTVHFIDAGVDSGPIIMQNLILADNFQKYGYDIFLDAQIELIFKTVRLLEDDRINIIDNKVIIEKADYSKSSIFPFFEC